ncbi:MAG: nuclear transport factor 2 family protein [Solirubrobacterales bacterium]
MSGDDIAVIRGMFEAFNARDAEAMVALTHPDGDVYPMRAQLEGRGYHGHEGIREMMDDLFEDWESVEMELEEFREGDEGIAALGRLKGCGRASGVDVDVPMGWVWKVADGKAVYAKAYSQQEDALKDAGVEQE